MRKFLRDVAVFTVTMAPVSIMSGLAMHAIVREEDPEWWKIWKVFGRDSRDSEDTSKHQTLKDLGFKD